MRSPSGDYWPVDTHSGDDQNGTERLANLPFVWVDSNGGEWCVHASPSGIRLERDGEGFDIESGAFGSDVYVSPMGEQAVVRLSGKDDEAGFLVSWAEAEEFVRRIQARPPAPLDFVRHAEKAASARRPMWPEMTAPSIWALICSALAFVPFAGFAFSLVALFLLRMGRLRVRPSPAWLHVRWVHRVCRVLLVLGFGVCLLGTSSWLQPFDWTRISGEEDLPSGGGYPWLVKVLSILVVLISLSVHECAHAITAWWCGDDYAKSVGRVTLDPRSHIDPFGTVILPLLLIWGGVPAFGYAKAVPVMPHNFLRFRRDHILVSIAGPGSNLLLAALALMLLTVGACVTRHFAPWQALVNFWIPHPMTQFTGFAGAEALTILVCALKLTVSINIALAVFNLIPVPPLDGSWVLEHLFPDSLGRLYARIRPFGSILFIAMFFSGALEPLMTPAWWAVGGAFYLLQGCLGI